MTGTPTLTPAMINLIDTANAQGARYAHIGHSHAEFVDWARANGVDGRIVDFLASRDDCAGTSPAAWTRLGRVGSTSEFKALPDTQRAAISRGLLGDEAFDAYVAWALDNHAA